MRGGARGWQPWWRGEERGDGREGGGYKRVRGKARKDEKGKEGEEKEGRIAAEEKEGRKEGDVCAMGKK